MPNEGTVLVVEPEADERERLGKALEERGYRVLACPGPTGPGYSCIGTTQGYCPLIERADVVVLNTWLAGDDVGIGATAEDLLALYTDRGRTVVAIGGRGSVSPYLSGHVITLPGCPAEAEVAAAVRSAPDVEGFVLRSG